MKYLDRILERLKATGDITSRKISSKKKQSENVTKDIKELMHIIGEPGQKPSFDHESLYQKWTSVYAFDMDILIMAARNASSKGKKYFSYLDEILTDWYNHKISTPADAKTYISQKQELDGFISAVFEAAGIPKRVTDAHRKIYAKWNTEWALSHDVILHAAEISFLSENPYRYLNSILSNWHNTGVKTLSDAQRETQKHAGGQSKTVGRASYERPIENLDHLAVDLFEDEGA